MKNNAAAQMTILTAQTSTNEVQTIETILGSFGICGWPQDIKHIQVHLNELEYHQKVDLFQ